MSACLGCGGSECICRSAYIIRCLTEACQIFTQALGSEDGYIPALGKIGIVRALRLMQKAGVEPIFAGGSK